MVEKKRFSTVVTIVLAIGLIVSFLQINYLKNEVEDLKTQIMYNSDYLSDVVGKVNSRVEKQLEEYTGLIESYDLSFKSFDEKTREVTVEFIVTPKEYTETTKIYFQFNGRNVELASKGNSAFSAEFKADLFEPIDNLVVLFKDGESIQTKTIDDFYVGSIHNRFLPVLGTDNFFLNAYISGSGKLMLNGTVAFDFGHDAELDIGFIDVMVVGELNGKEVFSKDISDVVAISKEDYSARNVEISKTVENIKKDDRFVLYAVAMDDVGLVHKSVIIDLTDFDIPKEESVRKEIDFYASQQGHSESIYDKKGNLLYS